MPSHQELKQTFAKQHDVPNPNEDRVGYSCITEMDELESVLEKYHNVDSIGLAVDTETSGLDHTQSDLLGISFSFHEHSAYYIPVDHRAGENASEEVVNRWIQSFLYAEEKEVYFYNSRFDLRFLRDYGIDIERFDHFDTAILMYNLDLYAGKYLSLKYVMKSIFKWDLEEIDIENVATIDPMDTYDYASQDALATYLIPLYFNEYRNNCTKLDNYLIPILMEMEELPKPIDVEYYKEAKNSIEDELSLLEKRIYSYLGQEINLDSPKQLVSAFKSIGIDTGEKTDSGQMSTSQEALQGLEHPIGRLLIEYRQLSKKLNSFITPFIENADENNELRFAYRNCKTATGRLSSGSGRKNDYFSDINAQNIEKINNKDYYSLEDGDDFFGFGIVKSNKEDADFRALSKERNPRYGIKPQPGCWWVSIDYSGQELRILANITGEERLIKSFEDDQPDFHRWVTDNILKKYGDFDRDDGKKIVYGVAYGAGPYRVSQILEISKEQAREVLDDYWGLLPAIKDWREEQLGEMKKNRYVQSYFNRRQYVEKLVDPEIDKLLQEKYWELNDKQQKKVRNFRGAERIAGNFPIQSAGAEIIKVACKRVYDSIISQYDGAYLEMQVHDEQNFSVTKEVDLFKEIVLQLKREMEISVRGWPIPFTVDVEVGPRFGLTVPAKVDNGELYLAGEYQI